MHFLYFFNINWEREREKKNRGGGGTGEGKKPDKNVKLLTIQITMPFILI